MTIAGRFAICTVLAFAGVALQAADGAPSPTGRTPKLLWTPQRQAVWNRMAAENHPWWTLLKSYADATGTATQRYDDIGIYCTLVYQTTGNSSYAQKAWGVISKKFVVPPSSKNELREIFIDYGWMYDWLYPGLTASQRSDYINRLNAWGDQTVKTWGVRPTDCDFTLGEYFGLAFVDLGTAPDNSRAGTFLKATATGEYATIPIGGLDSTGINRSTVRNSISDYAAKGAGGSWWISSEYNDGTAALWVVGIEGCRTATGVDHFPELTALLKPMALETIYRVSPEISSIYQWGDDEHPRILWQPPMITAVGTLAGLVQDDPVAGPRMRTFVDDMMNAGPPGDPYNQARGPYGRFFVFANPYATSGDWRTGLPRGFYASGLGVMYFHDGFQKGNSFMGGLMPIRTIEDHQVNFFGDFQLWRKNEWAVTHPVGYSVASKEAEGNNCMLIGGISSVNGFRGPIAQEFGSDDSYAYLAGSTYGATYGPDFYQPPPPYLTEWTRSLIYLPSSDKKCDSIVVYDRTNAENPKTQKMPDGSSAFSHYYSGDQTRINAAPALKQWIIHCPVSPTLNTGSISWTTAGGQKVNVATLLPASQKRTTYSESSLLSGQFNASELKYQVRVMPNTEQKWDTFLNVVQAADSGVTLGNTLVRSTGGEAEGVLIDRPGQDNVLAMFSAVQNSRVLSSGYTISWTATAPTAFLLADLSPGKSWTLTIDGGTQVPVTVSSQGIGRAVFSTTGTHTAQLTAGGQPVNHPPTITSAASGAPNPANVGQNVIFNIGASDSDGDSLSYAWTFADGANGSGSSATHAYTNPGTYSVNVAVSDGKGGTVSSSTSITVNAVTYTITASAGTGGTITPSGAVTVNSGANKSFTIAANSGYSISDVRADGNSVGAVTSYTFNNVTANHTIAATFSAQPQAPVITSALQAYGTAGTSFSYQIAATNSPTSFGATPLPAGLSVNSTGRISGTPTAAGTTNVTLRATNAGGTGTATLALTINAAANHPPVVSAAASATPNPAHPGDSVRFAVAATDSDGDTLSYAWSFGDGANGSGSGPSHTYANSGTYTATATISDGKGGSTANSVSVRIDAVAPPAPAITSPLQASGKVGAPFTYQITATNSPSSYGAAPLPAGLSVNAAGLISGTPTAAGTTGVTLSAANAGGTGTATLTITIDAVAVNRPPVISGGISVSESVRAGSAASFSVTAHDPDGDALSYAWNFGDGATAAGNPATHAYAQPGTYAISVIVSDGRGGSAQAAASLVVSAGSSDQPKPLEVSKLRATVWFTSASHDSCTLSGSFDLPAGFDPTGANVRLDVGGALANFTLDAKGKASSKAGSIQLTLGSTRAKRGKAVTFAGGAVRFQATLKNGSFAAPWARYGLVSNAKGTLTLPTRMQVNSEAFAADVAAKFVSNQRSSKLSK